MACDCGLEIEYAECCGPLLEGRRKANSAEELMRSRYVAFVKNNMDYLLKTHHPSSRDTVDQEGNEVWSRRATWRGLEIKDSEKGEAPHVEGVVEFVASYEMDGELKTHHERSEFRKEKGEWFYCEGKLMASETFVREQPKVGRNDPCICGSGKKYKKCCGAH